MTRKIKNKAGRPSKIDETIVKKLREAFLMGCTDSEACTYAEISRQTLYNFQDKNSEFLDQKELWKQNPIIKAKKTVFDNLQNVDTAKWYLERKLKDEFSTKQEHVIPNLTPQIVVANADVKRKIDKLMNNADDNKNI